MATGQSYRKYIEGLLENMYNTYWNYTHTHTLWNHEQCYWTQTMAKASQDSECQHGFGFGSQLLEYTLWLLENMMVMCKAMAILNNATQSDYTH